MGLGVKRSPHITLGTYQIDFSAKNSPDVGYIGHTARARNMHKRWCSNGDTVADP